MSLILENQKKYIKLYSNILDIKKKNIIIDILQLFYDSFSYEDNTSTVGWLHNQIGFFLDPYGFDKEYFRKRSFFFKKFDIKLSDCEYGSISLDKIILEMFSWSNIELKTFYKSNIKDSKIFEKSVYNLGLRKINQNGGGNSNEYVLKYIKSLEDNKKFNKTKLIFDYLNKLINENELYYFIHNDLDIKEIYIDNNTPDINIEKLFLYLLNNSDNFLNNIINKLQKFFIKFDLNKKFLFNMSNTQFSDKKWIYIKNKYNKYSYNFYKIFNNKLVSGNILISKNKYIKIINFILYNSLEINLNYSNRIYYYYFSINDNNKKFYFNTIKKNKLIFKKILLDASHDFNKKILKNKIFQKY
jgi:hypothetical protein